MARVINLRKSIPTPTQKKHNPFLALQNELDKAMNDFYNVFEHPNFSLQRIENLTLLPFIDVIEDAKSFKVEAEMPGLDEKDIKVSIDDGFLTIKAEKSLSSKDEDKNYLVREISYGNYQRSIPLPDSVDIDKAKASFKKGMLWVQIPKKAQSIKKSKELTIEKISK